MSSLQALETQLQRIGFITNLPVTEFEGAGVRAGPLIVLLEEDHADRERAIIIDALPVDADDPIELFQFRVVYPIGHIEDDAMGELARALFLLNRTLPIGHNGLCEETPGLYFAYTLAIPAGGDIGDAVIGDIIDLIDFLTTWHGALLDQVTTARITCADSDAIHDDRATGTRCGECGAERGLSYRARRDLARQSGRRGADLVRVLDRCRSDTVAD